MFILNYSNPWGDVVSLFNLGSYDTKFVKTDVTINKLEVVLNLVYCTIIFDNLRSKEF